MAYVIQTDIYRAVSERECEEGYIDLLFERNEGYKHLKYDWRIEIKYLKESERSKAMVTLEKAKNQLLKYAQQTGDDDVNDTASIRRTLKRKEGLRLAAVVFIGKKDYVMEELTCVLHIV